MRNRAVFKSALSVLASCSSQIAWAQEPAPQTSPEQTPAEQQQQAIPPQQAPAPPQQKSQPGATEGEIVVTAQKREQRLQDVGVAVTALGQAALTALGRQDITAIANQVPSLQTNQYSPTVTVFNIRGVSQNDFADQQEAPIAFYNDEVYVSALGAISGQTFDLERVEILRGPQGTLFGRNATGGLVQVVTAKPTSVPKGFATVTLGSFGQVATEGAISGPLSEHVRARLSVTSDFHRGYIKNRIGSDLGAAKFYGGRFQLAADLTSKDTLLLKLQGLRNDHERSGGPYTHVATGFSEDGLGFRLPPDVDFWGTGPGNDATGYRDPDNDPYTGSFDHIGRFDRKYWSATARYQHDFGGIQLVSITDYQKLKKDYSEDTDMSPNPIFVYTTGQNLHQLSEELRLSGDTPNLHWLAGIYGLKIHTDNSYQVDLSQSLGLLNDYGGLQKTKTLAVFGQAEYSVTDLIRLIGGLRYTWDRKTDDFTHIQRDVINGTTDVFQFNTDLFPNLAKVKSNDWSGKVQIEFRPSDGQLFYAGVSRGTKGGGFGVQAFQPINPETMRFTKERLTDYEAGFKLTLADRRVYFNGAVFHYDYKDYQAFTIVDLSQFISNKPARITGFELDIYARPVAGLTAQAFLSHLNTKVKDIILPFGRVTDRKMPQAPAWSLGGLLRYEHKVGAGTAAFETDWKYNSSQFFSTFNAPIDREAGYVVGNARISYTFERPSIEVAAFVNNLTDKEYRLYNLDLSTALGIANQTYARPRWFGVSLGYRY